MEIQGKVVVITGGAQGIGRAIAERFGAAGAKLVLGDVQETVLEAAVAELRAKGYEVHGVAGNIAQEADAEQLMAEAGRHFGRLDVAVLNAGILRDGLLVRVDKETGAVTGKMSLQQWQSVIDVNLTGVFLTGREAAVQMIQHGNGGVILLMSSISGEGNFGQTNYAATKAGVRAMTVTWSRELARYGIRVNSIAPGFIGTPMVKQDMKPEALEKLLKQVPVGRLGEPDEVAQVCESLVRNDFVTGVLWGVTGGMRL
ncbi:MAG: SDR family oxidoreductase [Myxococcota bacterium]|jgi:3-oxoacyl-[acyl-carrier protein] reductase|nr:SDR family oxidoreductase [Myxococcota bacterium]